MSNPGVIALTIIGAVIVLYLSFMIIAGRIVSKHDKAVRSMASLPEILDEYGVEGVYEENGALKRDKLTCEGIIGRDSSSLKICGEDLITGRYRETEFESSWIYISLDYGTDIPADLYYRGRITVMYPDAGPDMTFLLIQRQPTKKSGMTKNFGADMAIANGLRGFLHNEKIKIDPEWDEKWITYSDNMERTREMFAYGTKCREELMASQLDFILRTERSTVFGSKNDLVFKEENGKSVQQNVRDSFGEILKDLDAVMLCCT